jgi:hypothetical protein
MPSLSERWHHEFTATLTAATRQAGYTIDTDELDITVAHHADEVADWILAASHFAATGYLADVFDAPIDFMHDMAADTPGQYRDTELELIAYLRSARDVRRVAHGLARVALTSACENLSTTGLLWRLDPATDDIDVGDPVPVLIEKLAWALTGVGMRLFRPADPHIGAAWRYRDGAAEVTVAVRRPEPTAVTVSTRRHATEASVATFPTHTDPQAIIAAAYAALNTLAGPQPTGHPRWLAAQVSLPDVGGPYPARITTMNRPDTVGSAKLTAATVHAVIDDCRNRAEQVGVRPTTIRKRDDLIDLIDFEGTPDEEISTLAPDADGCYHLRWTWRITHPADGIDATSDTRHA